MRRLEQVHVPGTGELSVWCARAGEPQGFTRDADCEHYAASLVKLPLLLAAYRGHERGDLDLDSTIEVHDDFRSLAGGSYRADRGYDNDEQPWHRLGEPVSLRWLAARMIVSSSNLATNLLIERVGLDAVAAVSPAGLVLRRGIGDDAAAAAGVSNSATASAVGELLSGLLSHQAAVGASCEAMLALLDCQQYRGGIPAALPNHVRVGNKSGWVTGVLHDAAVVRPDDAPPYVLVVCTSGIDEARATTLIHDVTWASWDDRARLGGQLAGRERHAHH